MNSAKKEEGKGSWHKAIIGLAIAAIMLAFVMVAMAPAVSAKAITSDYLTVRNGFEVNPAFVVLDITDGDTDPIKIGQEIIFANTVDGDVVLIQGREDTNTDGEAFSASAFVTETVWDKTDSGIYFDTTSMARSGTYDVSVGAKRQTLSVSRPSIPIELKVGSDIVSTITGGTPLRVDCSGATHLSPDDCVNLIITDPKGRQVKTWTVDGETQKFDEINVAQLIEYGSTATVNQIDTTDWILGAYTFSVETEEENARGLDLSSPTKTLTMLEGKLNISVDKTEVGELQSVTVTVTGIYGHIIHLESMAGKNYVEFEEGLADFSDTFDRQYVTIADPYTGKTRTSCYGFNVTMEEDSQMQFSVRFYDTGVYTLEATDLPGVVIDEDTVDVKVSEKDDIVITSPLEITAKEIYFVGDILTAKFTVTNRGAKSVTFDVFVVGGRDPTGEVVDFDKTYDVTLNPGDSYDYIGYLTLPNKQGTYHFFCAYQTPDGNWNTNIEVETDGKIVEDFSEAKKYRERDIIVFEKAYISQAPPPVIWEVLHGPWEDKRSGISQIAVQPNNPEVVYAAVKYYHYHWGYEGDELYKSTNGGYIRNPINQGLPRLTLSDYYWPIRAIAIAPSNPDLIYVGTSDLNPYSSLVPTARGIYKSANGGSEWTSVGGPYTGKWIFKTYCPISSIIVDPIDPNKVYVGTVGGGIWRTINGGESWENIWDEPVNKETLLDVNAIAISPANPNTIYAAAYNFDALNARGLSGLLIPNRIIKSEDGGETWERLRLGILTAAPKIDDIAVDSKNADIVFVITEHYKVYKSTDGGKNWDDASGTDGGDPLPYVFRPWTVGKSGSIAMHPDHSNVIYASGEWGFKYVYVSPNSGENWLPYGDLKDRHVKELVLASNADSCVIYAAAIEGLFKVDLSEPEENETIKTDEVPILKVRAEVTVINDKPSIEIVNLEQDAVHPSKSPMSSNNFPAVDAYAIINNSKMSYWPAKDYHGNGTYDLVIGFYPDFLPKEGDMVKVVVKVVDVQGRTLATDIGHILWEMLLSEPFTFTNTIGMEFVLIPAGEFVMGSPSDEEGRDSDEGPVHHVNIEKAFYMGRYEVTQKQWREVMGDNPSHFKGDYLPVETFLWDNMQEFIKNLNEKEGTDKYRLPSEAEWEYACRAGTTTRYSFGDSESKLGDYAWYFSNSGSQTHPVGQKKSNSWGLYDMHGNVWEWVQDSWHSNYDGAPADGSAWEDLGAGRVDRGGGWYGNAGGCRSAFRGRDVSLGFRLLKEQ